MPVGLDGIAYRNTGSHGSPTWSAILSVKDVTLPMSATKVDASSRAATIKQHKVGQVEMGIAFPMVRDDDKTNYVAIRSACLARTPLDIAIADGPIATTGTVYCRMQVGVFKFEEKQPLEGVFESDIELGNTDAVTNPPVFVTVS